MLKRDRSRSDAESGWSGVSDNSSSNSECTNLEASSVASLQLQNGQEKLQELVHLPWTWPLARLPIPLAGLSKQIDRLLEGYCFPLRGSCGAFWTMLPRSYNDTQPLLTPSFWILPLYRELLNSVRRIRPSASSERARGCTGLVKIICKENKEQRGKRRESTMLGRLTLMIEGDLPTMVWVVQLNEYSIYGF